MGTHSKRRYRLLPYLYSLFHAASTEGGTVARPLLFEWPLEKDAVEASDTQWLLGARMGQGLR